MISFDDFFTLFQSEQFHGMINSALQIVIAISPIILVFILFSLFWPLWINYVRSKNFAALKYSVLEIRLPKEQMKSPLAMEVFLNSLHNTANGNKVKMYWKGEIRPSVSLELISVEGNVKFIIRVESLRKSGAISVLYSQFPGIEINEIEDYTYGVQFDPKENKLWGAEFEFTQPNPYPIKTYVDYGLDRDPKEEFKVDPLVPMLEFLGNVGPNQQIWIQYIIRAHGKDKRKPGHLFKMTDSWVDDAKKLVNEIMIRDSKTKVSGMKDEKTGFTKLPSISEGEQEIVEAIERSISKHAFDVGVRAIYIAAKDFFDPANIGGTISSFKHFSTPHLNGFKPNSKRWHMKLDYPWQDYKDKRRNRMSKIILEIYKRRAFFYEPYIGKPLIMNTEELATVYHFPGEVAMTPTLNRIPSKKSQAPANLPI
jgi:hypothetical protein